ncbi:hypothetical protein J7M23_09590 [Candidatus Sumerlaeota bacterium]|nr:hypothetical protein [Candidatus Sumerlaeota bacterium]
MKILEELPAKEYGELLREANAEVIYVGEKAYRLYPLTIEQLHLIKKPLEKALNGLNIEQAGINLVIEAISKIVPEIMIGLGVAEDIVKQMTVQQVLHIAGVLYHQNFDFNRLPEVSKKKCKEIWDSIKKGLAQMFTGQPFPETPEQAQDS